MTVQGEAVDREKVAQRLLSGSARRSYEPLVDLDWDAPLDPDKLYLPAEVITLYGTPLWDGMSPAQRQELSKQELANLLSVGIWFENLLNRMLLRDLLHDDPTTRHVHYSLTEMGDECRHMVMFGRVSTASARVPTGYADLPCSRSRCFRSSSGARWCGPRP